MFFLQRHVLFAPRKSSKTRIFAVSGVCACTCVLIQAGKMEDNSVTKNDVGYASGFRSGPDLARFVSSSPVSGSVLAARSLEPGACFRFCPSLSLPLPWVAQSVKRPTSAHNLTARGFKPRTGLCAECSDPALDLCLLRILCPLLFLHLPRSCSVSQR